MRSRPTPIRAGTKARKLYDRIVAEHPDTPWAVLARREQRTSLGLEWKPAAK